MSVLQTDGDFAERSKQIISWVRQEVIVTVPIPLHKNDTKYEQQELLGTNHTYGQVVFVDFELDSKGIPVSVFVARQGGQTQRIMLSTMIETIAQLLTSRTILKVFLRRSLVQFKAIRLALRGLYVVGCFCLDVALDDICLPSSANVALKEGLFAYDREPSDKTLGDLSKVCHYIWDELEMAYGYTQFWPLVLVESADLANICFWKVNGRDAHLTPAQAAQFYELAQTTPPNQLGTLLSDMLDSPQSAGYKEMRGLLARLPVLRYKAHKSRSPAFKAEFDAAARAASADALPKEKSDLRRDVARAVALELTKAHHAPIGSIIVEAFGSSVNGFGTISADLDICIWPTDVPMTRASIQKALKNYCRGPVMNIKASTPIFKFQLKIDKQDVPCDLSRDNVMGIFNSELMYVYSTLHPLIVPLILLVKKWTKARKINGADRLFISSYSYTILTIYYLLQIRLIPNLQDPEPDWAPKPVPVMYGESNIAFVGSMRGGTRQPPPPYTPPQNLNNVTISDLFMGFLHYYAFEFNYQHQVVSLRSRAQIVAWDSPAWQKGRMSIDDPFVIRNLGHYLTAHTFNVFRFEFANTYATCCMAPAANLAEAVFGSNNN